VLIQGPDRSGHAGTPSASLALGSNIDIRSVVHLSYPLADF